MNCAEFADWLDREGADGREEDAERASARRHASRCPECAASLRAVRELERALREPGATAPARFTDRVMERLPDTPDVAARVPDDPESPWSWWIQILFEPAAALGLALGLLYAAAAPALLGGEGGLPLLVERAASAATFLSAFPWLPGVPGATVAGALVIVAGLGLFRGSRVFFAHLTRLRPR